MTTPQPSIQGGFLAQPMGIVGIGVFGLYFVVLSIVSAQLLIGLWPGHTDPVALFWGLVTVRANPEADSRLTLVALLSAGLLAVHIFAPATKLPVPVRLTVLIGFAVAALCVILAGLIDAESLPSQVSSGRGAGYYLSLIVILAGGVVSFLRLRETGGSLPWEKNKA